MPVREIDMYGAPDAKPVIFGANRGASGIDGTIASAIGFATGLQKQTTLLVGDLAFLYDINSLAMTRDLQHPLVIIVFNNNGGGIFSFLPIGQFREGFEKFFGTPHHLTFGAAADLFGLNYARPESGREFLAVYQAALKSRTATIIEIRTDRAYNLEVHKTLQAKIRTVIDKHLS
jgi:2-succinyl-5-enolpyruvyl-6-hydroxy-3-cyclohexene-1-carboxylate synthase